jgi:hypothetical protein
MVSIVKTVVAVFRQRWREAMAKVNLKVWKKFPFEGLARVRTWVSGNFASGNQKVIKIPSDNHYTTRPHAPLFVCYIMGLAEILCRGKRFPKSNHGHVMICEGRLNCSELFVLATTMC